MSGMVGTHELTEFECMVARACDELVVDSDGLGSVSRAWLEKLREGHVPCWLKKARASAAGGS